MNLYDNFKRKFYFLGAYYFRIWAKIRLIIWNPRIFVITGSSGKTSVLHLIESQLKDKAKYSKHANSAYGIPFDILGLYRKDLLLYEWIALIIKAPFMLFKSIPKQQWYVVEADCDRPNEGKFLATLLHPEVTIWVDSSRTHSMNFEKLLGTKTKYKTVEEAIAFEFGYFVEYTKNLLILNSDNENMLHQLKRNNVNTHMVSIKKLKHYLVTMHNTLFTIEKIKYNFPYVLPKEYFYGIEFTRLLCDYLDISFDYHFKHFTMPPGRSTIFKAIHNSYIFDSSYNANLSSMKAILLTFESINHENKTLVLSDMLEQGIYEKSEHIALAYVIKKIKYNKLILMGPRIKKYVLPIISAKNTSNIIYFDDPLSVLTYLKKNITENELILFKGSRFLEGVIEHLLDNKHDVKNLCRREKIWQIRRKKWGL